MKDYSEARFWAVSGAGYGKGFTVEEAVANHDKCVVNDFPKMKDSVKGMPVMVLESPEDVDGFVLASQVRWTKGGKDAGLSQPDQIRAVRNYDEAWHSLMAEDGFTSYARL